MERIRRIGGALLRLIYPRRAVCMGCGAATGCREDWVCPDCRQRMAASWVGACRPPRGIDGAAYPYVYKGPAAGIVQRLKYSGVKRLSAFMAEDMARALRFLGPIGADCVAFVPMHPKRERRRGFNHAQLLAEAVALRLGLPCVNALSRVRNTPQQARLDDQARRRNLKGAFAARAPVAGRAILLVDDVCTTGSTAQACAKALRRAGAARVYLLCYSVAHPRRHSGTARG